MRDMDTGPRSSARGTAPLEERLRRRILSDGPIPFEEFMEAALYDPSDGFFSGRAVGPDAHFVTGPHLSPVFGILVARQVEDAWEGTGRPAPFTVVEAGAGDGTLARQVLDSVPPNLRERLSYVAVDRSPQAREALGALEPAIPGLSVAASLDDVPPVGAGCVIANEMLDNVPVRLYRRTGSGDVVEMLVDVRDARFVFVDGPPLGAVPDRVVRHVAAAPYAYDRPEATRLLDRAVELLERGLVWLVDYGFGPGEPPDSVHAYRGQRLAVGPLSDPEDLLSEPGAKDITAGVDFDALADHARRKGLTVWGPVSQRDAFLALGFAEVDRRAQARQVEAVGARRGIEALRIYSNRSRANLLLGRPGLGDFHVLGIGAGIEGTPASFGGAPRGPAG